MAVASVGSRIMAMADIAAEDDEGDDASGNAYSGMLKVEHSGKWRSIHGEESTNISMLFFMSSICAGICLWQEAFVYNTTAVVLLHLFSILPVPASD